MKLLTHNLLTSNIKGVKNGFPLQIDATEVVVKESDFNPDFIARMIHKIEWKALISAAQNLGHGKSLPEDISGHEKEFCENEEFLKDTHHILMEIEIMEGNLICPETGRKFPISKGIPNMLLKEDEI